MRTAKFNTEEFFDFIDEYNGVSRLKKLNAGDDDINVYFFQRSYLRNRRFA